MNTYQIIEAFKASMREADIEPPDKILADGVLHRFHIVGQKQGSLNGAYKLHLDGVKPAGYFEDFKNGIKANWKADTAPPNLSPQPNASSMRPPKRHETNNRSSVTSKPQT